MKNMSAVNLARLVVADRDAPARAVYRSARPPTVVWPCVVTMSDPGVVSRTDGTWAPKAPFTMPPASCASMEYVHRPFSFAAAIASRMNVVTSRLSSARAILSVYMMRPPT